MKDPYFHEIIWGKTNNLIPIKNIGKGIISYSFSYLFIQAGIMKNQLYLWLQPINYGERCKAASIYEKNSPIFGWSNIFIILTSLKS